MSDLPKSDEYYSAIDQSMPKSTGWMDTPTVLREGIHCYSANPKSLEYVGMPHARKFDPQQADWKLPENWQEILHEGFKERLDKYRSL